MQQGFASDVVTVIFAYLALDDHVRCSRVCKTWQSSFLLVNTLHLSNSQVKAHSADFVAKVLPKFPHVTELIFTPLLDQDWSKVLPSCAPKLTSLKMLHRTNAFENPKLAHTLLNACMTYTNLTQLSLLGMYLSGTSHMALVPKLKNLKKLTWLEIVGASITKEHAQFLADWVNSIPLKHLRLDETAIIFSEWENTNTNLTNLGATLESFASNDTYGAGRFDYFLSNVPKVSKLQFRELYNTMSAFAKLPLKELRMEHAHKMNNIVHDTLEKLIIIHPYLESAITINCPNLKFLDISDSPTLQIVIFGCRSPNLRVCNISKCPEFTDTSFNLITQHGYNAGITKLNLFECRSIKHPTLTTFKELKEIYVIGELLVSNDINMVLKNCMKLFSLTLCGVKDALNGVDQVNTCVQRLHLHSCKSVDNLAMSQFFKCLPCLANLAIIFNNEFVECLDVELHLNSFELYECKKVTTTFVNTVLRTSKSLIDAKISICEAVGNLKIANDSIEHLKLMLLSMSSLLLHCPKLHQLNMETLPQLHKLDVKLPKLDVIFVKGVGLNDAGLSTLVNAIPCCRKMSIVYCERFKSMSLSLPKLTHLHIERCNELEQITYLPPSLLNLSLSFLKRFDQDCIAKCKAKKNLQLSTSIQKIPEKSCNMM